MESDPGVAIKRNVHFSSSINDGKWPGCSIYEIAQHACTDFMTVAYYRNVIDGQLDGSVRDLVDCWRSHYVFPPYKVGGR